LSCCAERFPGRAGRKDVLNGQKTNWREEASEKGIKGASKKEATQHETRPGAEESRCSESWTPGCEKEPQLTTWAATSVTADWIKRLSEVRHLRLRQLGDLSPLFLAEAEG
jgi:hypothetical protein